MSPRTGRPTDNPKSDSIHLRLDIVSKEILDAYCEQVKISKAEGIRQGIRMLESKLKK